MRNATDKDPSIYILLIILLKIYTFNGSTKSSSVWQMIFSPEQLSTLSQSFASSAYF